MLFSKPMSKLLVEAVSDSKPLKINQLDNVDEDEQMCIAQWSDMILFDFLSANYDRFASLQVLIFIGFTVFL